MPVDETNTPAVDEVSTGTEQSAQVSPVPVETPSIETPSKPDVESLLKDADLRKQILEHPEFRKEVDYRVKSSREADIQARARQIADVEIQKAITLREQQAQVEADRQRILGMNNEQAGAEFKRRTTVEQQILEDNKRIQSATNAAYNQAQSQAMSQLGQSTFEKVTALAKAAGATEAELAKLDWHNQDYTSWDQYLDAVFEFAGTKRGEKLLRERLPDAVEAKVQERMGEKRSKESAPADLPGGTPSANDSDFMASYALGSSDDHARAKRILGI